MNLGSKKLSPKYLVHSPFIRVRQVNIFRICRDLAARNFLVVHQRARAEDLYCVKLADFGMARVLGAGARTLNYTPALHRIISEHEMAERVPLRHTAPETLLHATWSAATDVYALARCIWEVFADGASPYSTDDAQTAPDGTAYLVQRILQARHPARTEHCPPAIHAALVECWNSDPQARPGAQQLCAMLMAHFLETPACTVSDSWEEAPSDSALLRTLDTPGTSDSDFVVQAPQRPRPPPKPSRLRRMTMRLFRSPAPKLPSHSHSSSENDLPESSSSSDEENDNDIARSDISTPAPDYVRAAMRERHQREQHPSET